MKWTLSDLKGFEYISEGSKINLHNTTYICQNVNRWNDTVTLKDIGLQPEQEDNFVSLNKNYTVIFNDGTVCTNVKGKHILQEYTSEEDFLKHNKSYQEEK